MPPGHLSGPVSSRFGIGQCGQEPWDWREDLTEVALGINEEMSWTPLDIKRWRWNWIAEMFLCFHVFIVCFSNKF